jgi:hypothetical protein
VTPCRQSNDRVDRIAACAAVAPAALVYESRNGGNFAQQIVSGEIRPKPGLFACYQLRIMYIMLNK